MKTWYIPVVWQEMAVLTIEADTLSEAMEIAKDKNGDIPIPKDGCYLDDTWELSSSDEQYLRECFNDNQEDAL